MCGIAAIFGKKQKPKLFTKVQEMTSLIRHRGPDDEGFLWVDERKNCGIYAGKDTPKTVLGSSLLYAPKKEIPEELKEDICVTLGHRRLSIIDLSVAGHQPMCTPDQRYWIIYNGEIYNYLELKKELIHLGYAFSTSTDTEVILHAFQEWGKGCLNRFNGMFAFVLYDKEKQQGIAVRDRFGVKPLYFWKAPSGYLAFASEIKQFTCLPGWQPKVHAQMAYDFLNWGTIDHGSETLFEGVHQLRGGTYMEFSIKEPAISFQVSRWYYLEPISFKGDFREAAVQYRELLTDAVRLRLRADVSVGSCLSGGLDSSSIVCLMNDLLNQQNAGKQWTFSACSEVQRVDERKFIDVVVKKNDALAFFTYPSHEKLFEELPEIVWHQDEPFGSTSIYAQWLVFKMVRDQNVKVMLDGQGADEQLAGYLGFFGNHFYDLFKNFKWKQLWHEMRQSKTLHPHLQPKALLFNKLVPDFIRQPIRKMLNKSVKNPEWLNADQLKIDWRDPLAMNPHRSLIDQSLMQIHHSSLPMLLHFEDRDSMAHSVESRTPFLDYRLVEFTLGLPAEFKMAQGWTKRILRESMAGVLPDAIRWRTDKLGFATAEEEWVKKYAPDQFRKGVLESLEASNGILKPLILSLTEKMIQGKMPFDHVLWRWICFGQWVKRFKLSF
jgi:asparagine synthase (glutamine-hydrolysing)